MENVMSSFKKILIAIDLSAEADPVIEKALSIACTGCELHLVYVQEPMDSVYLGVVPYGPVFVGMDQVEEKLHRELKDKLDVLGDKYGIAADRRHFLSGTPAREIHRFADDNEIDLIVMGTHGQQGVQLLLGSTANSVLHGSNCDVLAVRIRAH
jgi:universal stress protein A